MKTYSGSIEKKLQYIIILVTFIAVLCGYFVFVGWYVEQQKERNIELSRAISKIISQDVAKILYFDNILAAADITKSLKSFSNLQSVVLYKKDMSKFFQYFKDDQIREIKKFDKQICPSVKTEKNKLYICSKIKYQDKFVAYATYDFSIESLGDILLDDLPFLLSALIFINLIAYILAKYYAKDFTNPILKLVKFLENIKDENFLSRRVFTNEDNEFGLLYEEINTMLERLEVSHEKLKIASVAFDINNGMIITNVNNKILQVNRAFEELTGYKAEEIIGKKPYILRSKVHDKDFYKNIYSELDSNDFYSGEVTICKKDKTLLTAKLTVRTVCNERGDIVYYVSSFFDVSMQKNMEKKLQYLERYDQLTGLINRKYMVEMIRKNINYRKDNESCIFICIDIEKFKMINEAYGFHFGNKILKSISKRLLDNFLYAKGIARIGADEFLIWFVCEYSDDSEIKSYARDEAKKILDIVTKPYDIDNEVIDIPAYVGIDVCLCKNKIDAEMVIKQSVSAVNIAKEIHQRVAFYDKRYQDKSLRYVNMHTKILDAIDRREFRLFYQLQHNDKAEPIGAEALMRWVQKDGTIVPPMEFIPFLEESGLILKLSEWIVKTACKQLSLWQKDEKTKHLTISINATSEEFNSDSYVPMILRYLKKYNVPRGLLKVELTESILIKNIEQVVKKMNELRENGVKISLDDFGTGFSSLAYLKDLPIDQLKIDQVFIKNVKKNQKNLAIVKSALVLGKAFDMNIIAEGVETKEDFEALKELNCKMYQGFYFAKPKPIDEIII